MKNSAKTKNDLAWEKLCQEYNILESAREYGVVEVTADQMRFYREPRLMAKCDHSVNIPKILAEQGLSILPASRGSYKVGYFDAYHVMEDDHNPISHMSLPSYIHSLDQDVHSESFALNMAYAAGIFADFCEDDTLVPTVSGRMSSGIFDFDIRMRDSLHRTITVQNSQIEIDAGYEGENILALVEAKMSLSSDFLVRQLYYPYRTWVQKIPDKRIVPIFMSYSNDIFYLKEYEFLEPSNYSSISLVKQRRYCLADSFFTEYDLKKLLDCTPIIPEDPSIPFPQADSFLRVINFCELLRQHPLSHEEITEEYAFDRRQTDYYANAATYLGLVEKKSVYHLTREGRQLLDLDYRDRQLGFAQRILHHSAFRRSLEVYLRCGEIPSRKEIMPYIFESNATGVRSESTCLRRAGTVRSWLKWIVDLLEYS